MEPVQHGPAVASAPTIRRPTVHADATRRMIRVWDPVVRLCHWVLVGAVLANLLELTRAGREVHQVLGYVALGVVVLRILWGFVGTSPARFASFVVGPRSLLRYLGQVATGTDSRHVGHNPAGGAMALVLLAMVALLGLTGWLQTTDALFGVKWVEETHEILANALVGLLVLHVLGALVESLRFRENLILAMITGRKRV
ncbi:cytochrome b/b6 domain-containing protein [Zavarzinia sp. CC-PAN008]|uniref:cytochrome b/b6 domain-containing protein n=1 Tax=Zavarzinia sp. CC-PAN008 TaxID=3243332 RepID=UPI003F749A64